MDDPNGSPIGSEIDVRRALIKYRKRLKSTAVARGAPTLGLNRFAKGKSRKLLKKVRRGKRPKFSKALLLTGKYIDNKLANGLVPDRLELWTPILQRRPDQAYDELILEKFSFIEHPQETINQLLKIIDFEASAVEARLHFDDQYCEDVAAYLVLAEMWPDMARVFRGGRMGLSIQKVVEALGLRRALGMKLPQLKDMDKVWAFPRRSRRGAGTSKSDNLNLEPQVRERVADDFCNALDNWLSTATEELQLRKQGKSRFAAIIGELLDNAERHSNPPGKDGDWSTAAFMAHRDENGTEVFRCHMGFLSVGASISESLRTASDVTREQIDRYITKHHRCGVSPDTLTTLVGLQDGVTRDREAEANNRGGIGFQEVLELISVLGVSNQPGKEPRMTIVSGQSCIMAKFPYLEGQRGGENLPRMLWFNKENSPDFPPDSNFVFDLRSRFPGTIIGLTFVLSKDDLMAVLNATD
ncbi:MAG: hypothetical protein JJ866_24850 [Roseibium sp.]|uniref:hypothetical protein n=1 Tax=Roseibium sp. TaxID=1936156 RepID=UPI001B189DE9|nr:hypothetical protein [Roseibium sp.]MBO6895188.1 hypothetical protein [Roseibium sp.]